MLTTMTLSYEELAKLSTFTERFNYLKLDSAVGDRTFGSIKGSINQTAG